MGWVTETITVDGVDGTFDTTYVKVAGTMLVWLEGVEVTYTEPTTTTFLLGSVPLVGARLRVHYQTNETVPDGRLVGTPEDPT